MHAWFMGYGRVGAWLGAALLASVGCSEILGLEDWSELPPSTSNGNAATCTDRLQNGLETDIDCGGDTCLPCAIGQKCANGTDCKSHTCGDSGLCEAAPPQPVCEDTGQPTCNNCVLDADLAETDIDCGGDACPPCDLDQHCMTDADCISGKCGEAGLCVMAPPPPCSAPDPLNPTCHDCTLNGSETDVDCGGDACPPCNLDQHCMGDADCISGKCGEAGLCVVAPPPPCDAPDPLNPTCHDCTTNGSETDVDCGSDACPPCDLDQHCLSDADCMSGKCGNTWLCVMAPPDPPCDTLDPQNPTCNDCTTNASETDVDCGGDACSPCATGKACLSGADCESAVCTAGICQ